MTVLDLTEKAWDAQLFGTKKGLATLLGWTLTYHTLRSKGSRSGFPDRVLVRDRLIAAELKTETGKVTDTQREWLDGLASSGVETYVWKPSDLDEIARILSKRWGFDELGPAGLRANGEVWVPRSLWHPDFGRTDTTEQQPLLATKGAAA